VDLGDWAEAVVVADLVVEEEAVASEVSAAAVALAAAELVASGKPAKKTSACRARNIIKLRTLSLAIKSAVMKEYVINVAKVEELQTISNRDELERIFQRAKSTIVNGERVILVRKNGPGNPEKFDEFSTLEDLQQYKKRVFKFLD
jgi:hypothetical protein